MNEVAIHTYLTGVRQFLANAQAEAAAIRELGISTKIAGAEMATTTKRGWLMNQTMFTLRRLTYGLSLSLIASGAVALKWGNDYNTSIQGARVALAPFFKSHQQLNKTLNDLWTIAKYSPFQIRDMTLAFSRMYPSLSRLGIGADETTRTLKNLTDALSVGMAGRVTPAALNRASVALQHLAFLGRLTGMSVLQLARDGIPIYAALSQELGLTADQMHNIGKQGIPAQVALEAINKYIESTPGYANAAMRLSQRSVLGLFSTFKDNISKTMGIAERGWFTSIQRMLVNVNNFFNRLNGNLSKTHNLMQALNETLTPRSNNISRVWGLISGSVRDAWVVVVALTVAFAHNRAVLLALLVPLVLLRGILWVAARTTWFWIPALQLWITYLIAAKAAALLFATRLKILAFWELLTARYAIADAAATWLWIIATRAATTAVIALNIAMYANPIGLVVAAVVLLTAGLVVLYFRWKRFHDAVNATAQFLYRNYKWLALIPVVGPFVAGTIFMIKHIRTLVRWLSAAAHFAKQIHLPHIGLPHIGIPGLASGGPVRTGGTFLVGERGPELLSLPSGSTVTPTQGIGRRLGEMININIYPQAIKLDGRVVAEVVARHQTAVNARA